MKIATFNINGIRRRLPNLLEWLREAQPDVVCLQELKAAQEAFRKRWFIPIVICGRMPWSNLLR